MRHKLQTELFSVEEIDCSMTNAEAVQNMSYVPVQNNPGAQLPHPLHSFSKQSAEAPIKTEQKEDYASGKLFSFKSCVKHIQLWKKK